MKWKYLLTISLSTLFISACGMGNNDNAINDTARLNQNNDAHLRSVTYNNTDNNRRFNRVKSDNSVGNVNSGFPTNLTDNAAYWDGRFDNRNVDNSYIDNWTSRGISRNDIADRNDNVRNDFTGTNTTRNINNNASEMNNRNGTNIGRRTNNDVSTAQKISNLNEVDRANVTISNNNAYVTVKLNNNGKNDLSKNLKAKISNVVRSTHRNIDNVYISHDPNL